MKQDIEQYFQTLANVPLNAQVTNAKGHPVDFTQTMKDLTQRVRSTHEAGNKIMFIGNGGSAAIASHMAIDYSKNGGFRSLAFNDGAALTCLANDLGYENVFAKQLDLHAVKGDLLIAISSSGKSVNILKAVDLAVERGCYVVTMSGFTPENPLRNFGHANFYLAAGEYGFVEIGHLSLCHCILDLAMGWRHQPADASQTLAA